MIPRYNLSVAMQPANSTASGKSAHEAHGDRSKAANVFLELRRQHLAERIRIHI